MSLEVRQRNSFSTLIGYWKWQELARNLIWEGRWRNDREASSCESPNSCASTARPHYCKGTARAASLSRAFLVSCDQSFDCGNQSLGYYDNRLRFRAEASFYFRRTFVLRLVVIMQRQRANLRSGPSIWISVYIFSFHCLLPRRRSAFSAFP